MKPKKNIPANYGYFLFAEILLFKKNNIFSVNARMLLLAFHLFR